ncbi:MAG: hypothetical protein IMZ66_01110 [Planctomycetes bacterium]|nr:hypothetical protein [Planctomycetota bacterium]
MTRPKSGPVPRRMRIYLVAVLALAVAWAAWSLTRLAEARAAAEGAAHDLATCRRLEGDILHLRARPATAADRERQSAEVTAPIEKAAREAGLAGDRLVRISPEPAQRVGETEYLEKPTRVLLKNVTLKQLARMAYVLGTPPTGLDLKSVRLTAPSRDASDGTWSAELVFVYLIYEPRQVRL